MRFVAERDADERVALGRLGVPELALHELVLHLRADESRATAAEEKLPDVPTRHAN
jgi:hypothetical protein